MEDTIFTKIIKNEIPVPRIYEDEHCIVILDKFPAVQGQTLIIPKQQEPYVFNLSDDVYSHIFSIAKKVSIALDKTYSPIRTCLLVEGFEVPHTHIKLYPTQEEKLNLAPGPELTPEEALKETESIKNNL